MAPKKIIPLDQMWVISRMQGWVNICKSINVSHYMNRVKDKNHTIIIKMQKKHLTNTTSFYNKNSQHTGCRRNILEHIQGHVFTNPQPTSSQRWKLKAFPVRPERRHKCPLPLLLFNRVLVALARLIKQEKEIKNIRIGKEVLMPLIVD